MTTRKLYSEELVQLSESLEEMGNLVEASLKNLFFSIENKDMQLAERIVADDRDVNNLERSIEAQCLMLITTPAAHRTGSAHGFFYSEGRYGYRTHWRPRL